MTYFLLAIESNNGQRDLRVFLIPIDFDHAKITTDLEKPGAEPLHLSGRPSRLGPPVPTTTANGRANTCRIGPCVAGERSKRS